jgi:hypothetical protein
MNDPGPVSPKDASELNEAARIVARGAGEDLERIIQFAKVLLEGVQVTGQTNDHRGPPGGVAETAQ